MDLPINDVINNFTNELNFLLNAETVEEALYGLIAYLHNGLIILNEVVARLEN